MKTHIKFHGGRVAFIDGNTGEGDFVICFCFIYLSPPVSRSLSVRFGPIFCCIAFRLIFGLIF